MAQQLNFADFYTEIIPFLDRESIINLSSINKYYHNEFTQNKNMWRQLLVLKYSIPLNTKNNDNTNWMHVFFDIIEMKKNIEDNERYDLMLIYDFLIEKNQELFLQDLDENSEKLSSLKIATLPFPDIFKCFFDKIVQRGYVGLLFYLFNNIYCQKIKPVDGDWQLDDIIKEILSLPSKEVEFLLSTNLLSEYINKIHSKLVEDIDLIKILRLDDSNFIAVVNKIDPMVISYIQVSNLLRDTLGVRDSYYPKLLQKYAYLINHMQCTNKIFEHYVQKKYPNNIGLDTFLSILVDTSTFDFSYKRNYFVRWACKNGYVRTVQALLRYSLSPERFYNPNFRKGYAQGYNEAQNNGRNEIISLLTNSGIFT